ncbi:MAG: AraC family transcriptional regulator [Bradyrhizobium sp.]
MSILEAALRGGAVAILLLFVLLFGRDRDPRTRRLSRYTAFLFLGVAAFAVDSAPGFWMLNQGLKIPIHVLCIATPAVFWIMAAALFDDEFRARWYHALAWLWLAVLAWWEMYGWPPAVVAVQEVSSLLLVSFGVWHALAGRAGDLVEWRRQLRVEFSVITALYIVILIVSQRIWPGSLGKAPFSLINAVGLLAFVFPYAWFRLSFRIKEGLALTASPGSSAPPVEAEPRQPPPATGQEAVLLEALRKLMVEGKVYREEGLSIASLSQSLGVQEYRLRRLINGQLGHRNFSAFVNGYRLAEVEAALADPGQAEVPILTIALDAGFGSIGPFNRAFKAHAGLTPTEYRRARLGNDGALLPIPESASRS